jgi:hypothetical protein
MPAVDMQKIVYYYDFAQYFTLAAVTILRLPNLLNHDEIM